MAYLLVLVSSLCQKLGILQIILHSIVLFINSIEFVHT